MNFKQFLQTDKLMNESYVANTTDPVVVGYGTFDPCHIGYLCLVSELIRLGEQKEATPVLVILEKDKDLLPTITSIISEHFPAIETLVEVDMASSILRLSQTGRTPVAVVGESYHTKQAGAYFKQLHNTELYESYVSMDTFKQNTKRAILANNFDLFRASILDCSHAVALTLYEKLGGK